MNEEHFLLRAAVYLILKKENTILLIKRENTGWKDGEYSLPSGHIDGDETVAEAMAREAKEEIGIDINPDDLKVVHTMHRISKKDLEYIDFYLTTDIWTGEPSNCEPDKCSDVQWFPIQSLPNNTIDYVKKTLDLVQNDISFSEGVSQTS